MTTATGAQTNETLDRVIVVAAAALGASLVLLRVANYGPAMWWDAVGYITAARNLLSDGLNGLGGPAQPPLYPAILAGGGLFGFDPYAVAGPINALIFGLTILVAGWWLRRHLHSRFLWVWGCISIALAFPLVQMASETLNESAFILFVTLSLTQIDAHLDGRGRASLILAAAFSALACLTRYIGPSLILAAVPMLLAARVAPREKMKHVAIYTLIAAVPLGLWLLRNFLVAGSTTGRRDLGFYSLPFIFEEALQILVNDWWLLGLTVPVLLAIVIAAAHAILRHTDRKRDPSPVPSDVAWGPFRVFVGFALAYLTMLVYAMMSGSTWDGLGWRFLTPVYIPLLVAALLLIDGALRYARRKAPQGIFPRPRAVQAIGWVGALAVLLMLGMSLQSAYLLAQHPPEIRLWNDGERQGYGGARWRNSESLQYVREADLTGAILSNFHLVTSLHAHGPARHHELLCEANHLRSALLTATGSGEVHFLYFFTNWRDWNPCPRQQDEILGRALSQEPLLEVVAELADGKLYRLRERELWPAIIFQSSGAPVEGKPFRALLNESHGRQLPGETWRWEKGGDADGWTSIPVQQPDDVYTPTVADVGHRIRASLYYEDRIGNRVKAIASPSEPVQPDFLRVVSEPHGSEYGRGTDPIITSGYDVYLHGKRLIYGNRICIWEDEFGSQFPLTVYSLNSESGTPERYALDFDWHRSSENNGTCLTERQLPDKDIVGIRTGQVDRSGNLLWEAEHWFEEKQRWFDAYLSSFASDEPVARSFFDVHLEEENLIFVKDPCGPEDTQPTFFVHLVPADTDDLPNYRKPYGFDNLDFKFDLHGERFDGKCVTFRALPKYDIASMLVGQYEGNSKLWTEEISPP